MSGNHHTGTRSETCDLKPKEAHLASICVAILFGMIGGVLGLFAMEFVSERWALFIAVVLGFIIPWTVCEYYFTTAHEWYGEKSLAHRIYDLVGIVAAVAIFLGYLSWFQC